MGLFGFGKKKDAANVEKTLRAQEQETQPVDREASLAKVEELRGKLEGLSGEEASKTLNEMGALYAGIDEVDAAIEAYEKSLEEHRVMGKASTALVKLYNKKRAAAAEAKDDAQIKYYMDKVTEMLNLSKDQLRGRA